MAKKRARGAGREPTRADLKAHERRVAATVVGATVSRSAVADGPAASAATPQRGVLPPRASRVMATVSPISREQEIAFIRGDLRRLVVLGTLMVAIIVVLAFFLH